MTDDNQLSSQEIDNAVRLYNASEDDLLREFGTLLGGGDRTRDASPDDRRARANKWLADNSQRLKKLLCDDSVRDRLTDSVMDVATLADVLSAELNRPGGYIVGAIVLKRGIDIFCR